MWYLRANVSYHMSIPEDNTHLPPDQEDLKSKRLSVQALEINQLKQERLQFEKERRKLDRDNKKLSKRLLWYKLQSRVRLNLGRALIQLDSDIKSTFKKISAQSWLAILTLVFITIETAILWNQNGIMERQNELFTIQNDKVSQQNLLIESQRKGSLVFLMGNIMDAVNNELREPANINRHISPQLKGQIISLSKSLSPYSQIIEDILYPNPYSPERGMLLVFLLESDINNDDLNDVLGKSDFTSIYLETLAIQGETLKKLDISNSYFSSLSIENSKIEDLRAEWSLIKKFRIDSCFECKRLYFQAHFEDIRINKSSIEMLDIDLYRSIRYMIYTNNIIKKLIITGDEKIDGLRLDRMQIDTLWTEIKAISEFDILSSRISNTRLNIIFPFQGPDCPFGCMYPSPFQEDPTIGRLILKNTSLDIFELRGTIYHLGLEHSLIKKVNFASILGQTLNDFAITSEFVIKNSTAIGSIVTTDMFKETEHSKASLQSIKDRKYLFFPDTIERESKVLDSFRLVLECIEL